jgi:hypothetical protein
VIEGFIAPFASGVTPKKGSSMAVDKVKKGKQKKAKK